VAWSSLAHKAASGTAKIIGPLAHDLGAGRDHDYPIDFVAIKQSLRNNASCQRFAGARRRINKEMPIGSVLEQPFLRFVQRLGLPFSEPNHVRALLKIAGATKRLSIGRYGRSTAAKRCNVISVKVAGERRSATLAPAPSNPLKNPPLCWKKTTSQR